MAAKDQAKKVRVEELETLEAGDLLGQMIDTGIKPSDDTARDRAKDLIKNFVEQILDPGTVVDTNVVRTINARIAAIDEVLSRQVDKILHHGDFQKLEATWRGLKYLLAQSETGRGTTIQFTLPRDNAL